MCAVVAEILRGAKVPYVGGTLAQWSAHKESFAALKDRVDAVRACTSGAVFLSQAFAWGILLR